MAYWCSLFCYDWNGETRAAAFPNACRKKNIKCPALPTLLLEFMMRIKSRLLGIFLDVMAFLFLIMLWTYSWSIKYVPDTIGRLFTRTTRSLVLWELWLVLDRTLPALCMRCEVSSGGSVHRNRSDMVKMPAGKILRSVLETWSSLLHSIYRRFSLVED